MLQIFQACWNALVHDHPSQFILVMGSTGIAKTTWTELPKTSRITVILSFRQCTLVNYTRNCLNWSAYSNTNRHSSIVDKEKKSSFMFSRLRDLRCYWLRAKGLERASKLPPSRPFHDTTNSAREKQSFPVDKQELLCKVSPLSGCLRMFNAQLGVL